MKDSKLKHKARVTILLVVASFVFAHLLFLVLPSVFEPWNARTVDLFFTVRSSFRPFQPSYDKTVVHLDINNTTIQKLNHFYLNRSHYARVIGNLAAMGTAVQAYDFIFAARMGESEDRALIESASAAGNVYFGMAFHLSQGSTTLSAESESREVHDYLESTKWRVRVQGDDGSFYHGVRPLLTFPELARASKGLGFLSIKPDRDGVFRRVPLLVHYGGACYPSLPFRIVCDYLGVPPEKILVEPGKMIRLQNAAKPGEMPRDIEIPIDGNGNMVINYIGPWERMDHYNFADVFLASEDRDVLEMWKEELAGKIVMISDVSTGSTDIGPVPADVNFPLSALHANVIHTIISGKFLRRLSMGETAIVELFLSSLVLLLALRSPSSGFSAGNLVIALTYVVIAGGLFLWGGLILHVMRPLFFITFATVSVTAFRFIHEEKEKEFLRKTFEAYFPPAVVKKIIANPEVIASRGQRKELTILFSDIKDFTSHTSTLPPDDIQRALNEYFQAMVEIVFAYQGTVDKYIGDGLMVFFGDPEPQPDHALQCVRAAVDMQRRVCDLRDRWVRNGGIPIHIRIGINTGEVVVGNMGSARRLSYTVLGSPVNLAQRLEAKAPVGGILIAERTYELVKDHIPTRSLGAIQVKGIDHPVNVYEVELDSRRS